LTRHRSVPLGRSRSSPRFDFNLRFYAINPLQVARYRERHSTSGAKSDPGDAHLLAEIVRLDRAHHRRIARDSEIAEHVKVAAREGVVAETGSPSPPDCQPEDRQH
jgi:hypothetical protein